MLLREAVICAGSALFLAGCGTLPLVNASADLQVDTTRKIVGTSLIGATGKTAVDQHAIDDVAVGMCESGAWTKSECDRHTARNEEEGK